MSCLCRLEEGQEFERAAAIAVFTLKVTRAIEVLRRGATSRQSQRMSLRFVTLNKLLKEFLYMDKFCHAVTF